MLTGFAVAVFSTSVDAKEPFAEFVEKLRERRYFDTALEYLDGLAKRSDLPTDFQETLDLERGITYRAMASASRVPEDREQALTQAELSLKKFTSAHAGHPRAPFANSELGQLLFERARSLLWDSESPSNADRKAELQQQARAQIEQAKAIYQAAHDQYKAQYDAFPSFIDETQEPEQYEQRKSAEVKYLLAWFNLVRCTYELGQTYDKGTKERNDTLVRASEEFEAIHSARRTNPIGLQSRLMMGKCFQEQDDLGRALGIYNEMLSHKSDHPSVQMLKSIALQYRLICLNDEKKNDFQLVLQEADAWLKDKDNRRRLYSENGLGILWEKAIAQEKLGRDRTIEDPKERAGYQKQALADAKDVSRFPSPYREAAVAMVRRLNAELGEQDAEPKDFDTAFERARGMVSQLQGLKDDVDKAQSGADKQKARQAVDRQMNEIGRLLELALQLREPDSDPKAAAQARYLLSYVYMSQRKSFEAIILARYCMNQDRLKDPDTALAATEIAIQSAIQAFNDADRDQEYELNLLKEICELITSQYPQSARGNEARVRLGQVYRDLNDPLKAAETYLTVPKDYSGYASARMQAGQSYWLAWINRMAQSSPAESDATSAESDLEAVRTWKTQAAALLQEGIQLARTQLGKDAKPNSEIVAGEVSLATILNMDGKFDQTIQRLTSGGPNAVVNVINVAAGESRPATGIQSAAFAGEVYRLLLRAYVGNQKIDEALKAMTDLEAVGGQDTAGVYTQLGRELQEELQRLKAAGETERLAQVRTSFEQFLAKVYETRNKSDYNSLLWIGETYYGLGQGVSGDDSAAATEYFTKANAAYQEILDNNLAEGPTVLAIKLRIVRCRRAMGQYDDAVKLAQDVLAENTLSLDVQFEAAYALSDWGADPNNGQPDKLLAAMQGMENAAGQKTIWGWSGLTNKLQARRGTPEWETLEERFLEARYEYVNSRYRYAKTGAADADTQLKSGAAEIMMFARVFADLPDTWFAKFDSLYQNIQTDLGEQPKPLERPKKVELPPEATVQKQPDSKPDTASTPAQAATSTPVPSEGPNAILIAIALALAAGGGFAAFKLLGKPQKRVRTSFGPAAGKLKLPVGGGVAMAGPDDAPSFAGLAGIEAPSGGIGLAAPPKKKRVATAPEGRSASSSPASGRTAAVKPNRPATPEEAAAMAARKKAAAARAAAANAAQSKSSTAPGANAKAIPNAPAPTPKVASSGKNPDGTGAAAAQSSAPKKRVLTPEEMARYKAAKLAKAKAEAQAAAGGATAAQSGGKVVRKPTPDPAASPAADGSTPQKKVVRKRPPQPPAE
ncbi:MAG: hypothetical protein R3C59_31545 [Planctomycetaceae bacterium]